MIGGVHIGDEVVRKAFERAPAVMNRVMDRAVGKAGQFLAREVRRELRHNGSMGFSTLMNSIRPERPFPLARDVKAGVKYARFVEDGTQAGYRGLPPTRPLAEWLRIKHGLDEHEAKRRAFGLARYIRDHGTEAHPYFKPAFEKNETRLMAMLREGAAEGVRTALGVRDHYAMTGSSYGD
ncbi:hypothetical protein [Pseudogulbenkiania ferrooxidans]|uniref:Phage protein, HK97 gp10 family n=1 Tax=Pseudogulbenkiania ferrooxidans 2002 TaxID=279714 RepID=B9Z505_9NEIS|nr:hypothetical protein [Pseudogulbenkiania ferrooxidans]EEG08237.1 hypothetical protein FuraDRAFT_2440 [Pseudogulbenkiania ferrooxidans 2002]